MPVLCFEWVAAISNRGPADEKMWVECGVESGAARKRMVHASLLLPSAARSYAYTERRCFARGNGAKSVARDGFLGGGGQRTLRAGCSRRS